MARDQGGRVHGEEEGQHQGVGEAIKTRNMVAREVAEVISL